MENDVSQHLEDIREYAGLIQDFTAGFSFEDYRSNTVVRLAVERCFGIMGEALRRIERDDPEILSSIRSYRAIINFRNILAHAYQNIEDRIVWGIIERDLPLLIEDVKALSI